MTVKQICIGMANQPGQLVRIGELMGEAGINIIALCVATSIPAGEGLLYFVPDNPDKAANVLASQDIQAKISEVIAVETPPPSAGGLLAVLNPLKRAAVNVEYLYTAIQTGEANLLILGVAANQVGQAVEALKKDWIRLYGEELL